MHKCNKIQRSQLIIYIISHEPKQHTQYTRPDFVKIYIKHSWCSVISMYYANFKSFFEFIVLLRVVWCWNYCYFYDEVFFLFMFHISMLCTYVYIDMCVCVCAVNLKMKLWMLWILFKIMFYIHTNMYNSILYTFIFNKTISGNEVKEYFFTKEVIWQVLENFVYFAVLLKIVWKYFISNFHLTFNVNVNQKCL